MVFNFFQSEKTLFRGSIPNFIESAKKRGNQKMPKKAKDLTALEVKRLTTAGRVAVGTIAGLLLSVKPGGSKSWILRTMIADRRRNIGLGPYPEISLKDAHDRARVMKRLIEGGIDPIEEKRAKRAELKKQSMSTMSFSEAARQCHKKKSLEFKNAKHIDDWISSIQRYADPIIGDMSVSEIELPQILAVLEPIWTERTETANRLRLRIEQVLNWATVSGYREGLNPARWAGHLSEILAKPSKIKKETHFRALPYKEIGAFMPELRKREAMTARALEWIILTACRSGECRGATWEEIDLKNKVWIIPAERMKMGQEHRVPLCDDALKLLENLPRLRGSNYLFTAARGGQLSDMSISMLCRRMGVDAVPHGFRSTFKDWCSEQTAFPDMVSEMALAHGISNEVQAAYRRGDLFEKRVKLMDAWAEYLNTVQVEAGSNVTPIKRAI
ncbi:MAG: integrase arm-type DNA-binding domain-containing protein [Desulfobacula sp.]|jgi:integrase